MAARARFITYDGGIAFSENAVKIQKQDGLSKVIPLDSIASLNVRRPQENSDGFIRLQVSNGPQYRLYFEPDQLEEAIQFKRRFQATLAGGGEYIPAPPARTGADRPAKRVPRETVRPEEREREYPEEDDGVIPLSKLWWLWVLAAVAIIGAIALVFMARNLGV